MNKILKIKLYVLAPDTQTIKKREMLLVRLQLKALPFPLSASLFPSLSLSPSLPTSPPPSLPLSFPPPSLSPSLNRFFEPRHETMPDPPLVQFDTPQTRDFRMVPPFMPRCVIIFSNQNWQSTFGTIKMYKLASGHLI